MNIAVQKFPQPGADAARAVGGGVKAIARSKDTITAYLDKVYRKSRDALEKQINSWIRENKIRVTSVFGNIAPQSGAADPKAVTTSRGFAPSDVLVIVLYETP